MTSSSLSHKAASAGLWVVGGRLLARVLDLVSLLVLARLLTPADFGIVAIATTILSVVEAILEIPVNQALIRQQVISPAMLSTAFSLSLVRGVAVAALMILLGWPLAIFYDNPALFPLTCVLSLAPALRGLTSPGMVVFMQEFDFRREFALDVSAKLATLIVASSIALTTGSYWALAAGSVVGPLAATLLSYVFAPLAPRITFSEWPIFRDMVGWNTVSQILNAFNWQTDRLLLPRYTSVSAFGAFSVADTLASIPLQTVVVPLLRPLNAAFAKLTNDAERSAAYGTASAAVVTLAAPALIGIALLAEPALRIVVGEKWVSAAPILSWIATIGLFGLPLTALSPLVMALDRTRYGTLRMAIEMCVKLPATILGVMYYGIEGALAARALAAVAVYAANVFIVRHLIGMSVGAQLKAVLRPFLAGASMATLLWFLRPLLDGLPVGLPLVLLAGLVGLAGIALFWFVILTSWQFVGRPKGIEALAVQKMRAQFERLRA